MMLFPSNQVRRALFAEERLHAVGQRMFDGKAAKALPERFPSPS